MIKRKQPFKISDIFGILLLWFLVAVILILIYGSSDCSLKYPLAYYGGDETSYMAEVKMMLDGSTWYESDKLGAPFGTNRNSIISYYLFHDVHLLSFLFVKLTKNVGLAVNLTFFTVIFLISGISYAVLRSRKIHIWLSVLGSLVFTFQSYLFYRNIGHLMLSAYQFVPLAVLLSLWIFEDDNLLLLYQQKEQRKKNISAILFGVFIGINGIGYYPVFSCFFIMIAGVAKALQSKKIRGLMQAVLQCMAIVAGIGISISRYLWMRLSHNGIAVETARSMSDIELYSLKIARLFIPGKSTGIDKIDTLFNEYSSVALAQTETTEFLGMIGCFGFIILLGVLFVTIKKESKYYPLKVLSFMNISAVLFATVGGLGVFFFLFVTKAVRCSNRMSIFIAFISILTVCILLNEGFEYINQKLLADKTKNVRFGVKAIGGLLAAAVFAASLYIQIPYFHYNNSQFVYAYENDEKFVEEIEASVPAGSMIFELPGQIYLSGTFVNNMWPDQLFMPYLHSKELRWSYGSFYGEDSQRWCTFVANQDTAEMIDSLAYMGFAGIYIDTRAYTEEELQALQQEIETVVNTKPSQDGNRTMLFYNISSYAQELKQSQTDAEWNEKYQQVINYR